MFKAPLPAKQAGRTPAANLQGRLKRNSRSKTLQQREDEHLCRQRPPPRGGDRGRGAAGDVQDKEAGAGTMARAGHPAGGELPLKFVAPPKGAGRPGAPRGASLVGLSDTEPSQKSAPSCPPVAALQTRGDTDPTRLESSLCNQANQSKRLAIRHGRTPSFPRRAAGLSGSAPAPPERPAGSTLSVPASA